MTDEEVAPQPRPPAASGTPPADDRLLAELLRRLEPGLIVVHAGEGRVVFLNESAAATLALLGSDGSFGSVERLFLSGGADGAPRTLRAGSRLVGYSAYSDGAVRWIFCRDITEKLQRESVGAAAEAASLYGGVFAAIRHEVGNPLNSAKTALAVLRRNADRLDREGLLAYVDRALHELGRVEALLHLMKAFFAPAPVEVRRVDLAGLLADVEAEVASDLEERGIWADVYVEAPARVVLADAAGLRHVLLALLANSATALEGRPAPRVSLRALRAAPRLVELRVADNGRGMPEEVLRNVFVPLFASDRGRVGVGLATARALLSRMDGAIEVESEEGVGTTVRLTLRSAVEEE